MMMHRYRRTTAVFLAAGSMCALAACGSSSSSGSSGSGSSHGGAPGAFKLTASEQACLKKHGVTLPSGAAGRRPPAGQNGAPPRGGQQGAPPSGKLSKGKLPKGKLPKGGFGMSKAQIAALKACGVTVPSGGPGSGQTSTAAN